VFLHDDTAHFTGWMLEEKIFESWIFRTLLAEQYLWCSKYFINPFPMNLFVTKDNSMSM
jgi:hypothetical protein